MQTNFKISSSFIILEKEELFELDSLIVFPFNERLAKIFPLVNLRLNCSPSLTSKLSFCLPRVEIPSIAIEFDEDLLNKINVQILPLYNLFFPSAFFS